MYVQSIACGEHYNTYTMHIGKLSSLLMVSLQGKLNQISFNMHLLAELHINQQSDDIWSF